MYDYHYNCKYDDNMEEDNANDEPKCTATKQASNHANLMSLKSLKKPIKETSVRCIYRQKMQ